MREYVYYPGTFRPLALLTQQGDSRQSWHYHCDPNGAPVRLTSVSGEIVWAEKTGAWGEKGQVFADRIENPLRFQGQYFDAETGLHYNRYRYYDPEIAGYISQDPIGLAGGTNTYSYVPDPFTAADPLGLARCKLAKAGEDLFVGTYSQVRRANLLSGLNPTHTPHHAIQNAVSPTTHGRGITINIRKDLHEKTWTYRRPLVKGLTKEQYLERDVKDLRTILKDAGYKRSVINRQLSELIRQNRELWKMTGE